MDVDVEELQQYEVVLIDDHPDEMGGMTILLEALGLSYTRLDSSTSADAVQALGPTAVLVAAAGIRNTPFELCRQIRQRLAECPVLLYGAAPTADVLKKAITAGVQRFLALPLTEPELAQALLETRASVAAPPPLVSSYTTTSFLPRPVLGGPPAVQPHRLVTCFSPKGGVGCSTVAVNLAVSLQRGGRRVAILDGSFSSGTVDTFMGLAPTNAILHLVHDKEEISTFTVQQALVRHSSGVQVLLAPREPEQGETITTGHLQLILKALRALYEIVVVDTTTGYDERVLLLLDSADRIVVPVAPDVAAVKNLASFLRLSRLLGHPAEKLILVLVRADSVPPDQIAQIEQFLGQSFSHHIPSDGRAATSALNDGAPIVLRHPHIALAASLVALSHLVDPTLPQAGLLPSRAAVQDTNGGATHSLSLLKRPPAPSTS